MLIWQWNGKFLPFDDLNRKRKGPRTYVLKFSWNLFPICIFRLTELQDFWSFNYFYKKYRLSGCSCCSYILWILHDWSLSRVFDLEGDYSFLLFLKSVWREKHWLGRKNWNREIWGTFLDAVVFYQVIFVTIILRCLISFEELLFLSLCFF